LPMLEDLYEAKREHFVNFGIRGAGDGRVR
jgi:hypothetical protein